MIRNSLYSKVYSEALRQVLQVLGDVEEGHPAPLAPAPNPLLLHPLDRLPPVLGLLPEEQEPEDVDRPGVDWETCVRIDDVSRVVPYPGTVSYTHLTLPTN